MLQKWLVAFVVGCAMMAAIPALLNNVANVAFKRGMPNTLLSLQSPQDYCFIAANRNAISTESCSSTGTCVWGAWRSDSSLSVSTLVQSAEQDQLARFLAGWHEWCNGAQTRAISFWENDNSRTRQRFTELGEQALLHEDAETAVEWLELASRVPPQDSKTLLLLGNAYLRRNQAAAALQAYRQSIALNPNQVQAFAGAAMVEHLQRDYEQAALDISHAIALAPANSYYWQIYGGLLLNNLNQPAEAEIWLARVVEVEPKNHQAHIALAVARVRQTKNEKAKESLQHALEYAPDAALQAKYLDTYAAALTSAGDLNNAAAAYELALERDPSRLEAAVALVSLYAKLERCDQVKAIVTRYPLPREQDTVTAHALNRCGLGEK